ncbi:MAG: DUF4935 domain-containing protein [Hormoscilla sp. SP5CHS1]|nr:DUF4935 domain-containing protein [Hormoscilla sp. SP12CHS1]MBC6454302.1 DUF4935 domain-containing protein [Hormoscilla sp. SP5CHS1]
MSLTQKRNPAIESLLSNLPNDVQLILPSICYMEALFAFQQDKKRRKEFDRDLAIEINEAKRSNLTVSQLVMNDLKQSQERYDTLSEQLNTEFIESLMFLASRLTLIHPQPDTLVRTLVDPKLNKFTERRDDLILCCIVEHAQNHSSERKAFFSENTKQFGQQPVREVYREVGITYFGNVENLQGWLRS